MNDEKIFIKGREVVSKNQLENILKEFKVSLYDGIVTLRVHAMCDDGAILNPYTKTPFYLTDENTEGLSEFMQLYDEDNYDKANILLFAIFDDRLIPFINGVTSPPANRRITFYSGNVQDDSGNICIYQLEYNVSTQKVCVIRESNSYTKRSTVDALIRSSETTLKEYTSTSISQAIGNISQFSLLPVDALPIENIQTNVIYAVPSENPEEGNERVEWVYVNEKWECLGIRKIDLSNYYTKTEIDKMIGDINSILASMTTVEEVDE